MHILMRNVDSPRSEQKWRLHPLIHSLSSGGILLHVGVGQKGQKCELKYVMQSLTGLSRGLDKIYEGKTEDWNEMIDTNIKGLLYVTRIVLPGMVKRNKGHIINIGSIAGHEAYPGGNVYSSTKFAVNGLTKSFRIDLLGKNIKVSSVDPGLVETEFSIVRYSGDEEKAKNTYKGLTPLIARDIAETVFFCANRPEHVNIDEIIMTPVAQASTAYVHREK
ncbi:MAG: SDR family NAD(P)-dependent oxidoreductase [Ignavibacteriaceae bacterium]